MAEISTIARPYATAVFNFANESKSLSNWSDALVLLSAVVKDEHIKSIIEDSKVLDSEREDLILKYGGVGSNIDITKNYIVVMQHPVTTEYDQSRNHIEETLKAIHKLKIPTFWFWPNVDAGSDGTSKGIRSYREKNSIDNIHFFKNMEPNDFLKLLNNCNCLIGNSSVGIRECAFLGVPVVNIGSRQNLRDRGNNVIDVGYNSEEIERGILTWLNGPKPESSLVYGGGNAGFEISNILSRVPLKFHKNITY